MNPRQIPFLRLLLPWATGVAAGAWLNQPLAGLGYGLLAGAVLLVFLAKRKYAYRFRWVFGGLLFVLMTGAGYYYTVRFDERFQANHFSRITPEAVFFTGMVYDAPSRGSKLKVLLHIEAAGAAADSLRPCSGNILLSLDITPESERLRYGDRLWVQAGIRPAAPPQNPNAFDYRQYLHFQNIHYQAYVKNRSFGVIATGSGYPLWRIAFRWRERLLAVLREHFPGTDEYAVASALLVGYTDDLSDDLRAAYAETGSMHALAVSGTHVGLLYTGLLFLLRRIPWSGKSRRWGETALVLTAIWAFTLVTGATASVLRASVMFSTFLVGKAIRRQGSIWNTLAASAFGLLVLNPYLLFNAGFQLSYAAVAGMVLFYPAFQKRSPSLPKWASEGWNILLIGVAAQIGTLPLSLYYFHQFPVYFWLAGWVVVLGGAVFLWGGAVLALLSALAPGLAEWLGWALYGLVWSMNRLIQGIQHLPGSVIAGIWINGWAAALIYFFIGALAGAFMLYRPRWLLVALGALAVLGICRAGQVFEHSRQRQITLYHVNRHFLLDFFFFFKSFVCSDSLNARQQKFAAQANRWAHGIRNLTPVNPADEQPYVASNLFVRPPFLQFFQVKMAVVDDPRWVQNTGGVSVEVDVLLIRDNPNVRLDECLRQFPCRLVVFDASNSPKRVERWKAECRELQLPIHDVREQGAWVAWF